jgi:hypothetical protein
MLCILCDILQDCKESFVYRNPTLLLLMLINRINKALLIRLFPVPVAALSKAWVCGRSLAGVLGSNPSGSNGYLSVVIVVCSQADVSATS